jgi:hypothetical protein
MTNNEADLKDLSYWALKVAVRAMVGEILIRRAMTSGEALQAVVDGVDEARENVWEAREKANAGH